MPEELTVEQQFSRLQRSIGELVERMGGWAETQTKIEAAQAAMETKFAELVANNAQEFARSQNEAAELRKFLAGRHGRSGTNDWMHELGKFFSGVYHLQRHGNLPDFCKLSDGADFQKADYTTSTGATAGYMVPDFLMPDLLDYAQVHGNVYPLLTKFTLPPGATAKINRTAANPTATWRTAQGTAMTESGPTVGQDSVTTALCGSFIKIANELLEQPNVGFVEKAAPKMVRAIVRAKETGVISGDDQSGATDPPSDGIINDGSTQHQVAAGIADSTPGALMSFLSECVDDYEASADPTENVIVLSPAKLFAMAQDALTATGLTGILTWGNPVTGIPPQFFGFPVVGHPGCKVSTTHYATLMNPGVIQLAETGRFAVDLNPFGTGWESNETWLRVFDHSDWSMGQPLAQHWAAYQ